MSIKIEKANRIIVLHVRKSHVFKLKVERIAGVENFKFLGSIINNNEKIDKKNRSNERRI